MTPFDLHAHIHATYHRLRVGLALLAAIFPVLLVVLGYLAYSTPPQESMSAYYFSPVVSEVRSFPMRGWFVGVLWAIGTFLVLYRGYSRTEDWLLNVAGVSAIAVALIHMRAPEACKNCGGDFFSWWPWAHGFFAALLFVCVAWVAFACSEETLHKLDPEKRKAYRSTYDAIAALMLGFPLIAAVLTFILGSSSHYVIVAEALGIWTFAAYWYVKSKEISLSDTDRQAVQGRMVRRPTIEPPTEAMGSVRAAVEKGRAIAARAFDKKEG